MESLEVVPAWECPLCEQEIRRPTSLPDYRGDYVPPICAHHLPPLWLGDRLQLEARHRCAAEVARRLGRQLPPEDPPPAVVPESGAIDRPPRRADVRVDRRPRRWCPSWFAGVVVLSIGLWLAIGFCAVALFEHCYGGIRKW